MCVFECTCVRACVRAYVRVRVCVCVREREMMMMMMMAENVIQDSINEVILKCKIHTTVCFYRKHTVKATSTLKGKRDILRTYNYTKDL